MLRELGVANPTVPPLPETLADSRRRLTVAQRAIGGRAIWPARWPGFRSSISRVFFAVLLVGFAYVWKRGDLDWVRAVSRERAMRRALSRRRAKSR